MKDGTKNLASNQVITLTVLFEWVKQGFLTEYVKNEKKKEECTRYKLEFEKSPVTYEVLVL